MGADAGRGSGLGSVLGSGSGFGSRAGAGSGAGAGTAAAGGSGSVSTGSPHGTGVLTPSALPGMPGYDPSDLYAFDRPGMVSPVIATALPRVYVPNTESDTVTVIDPADYHIIQTMQVGH
jgi:YVTN family beta-propeller protein